jgi:hypothetical protein
MNPIYATSRLLLKILYSAAVVCVNPPADCCERQN